MAKFTVDRKTWYRGQDNLKSRLLREKDGMRCCIGFVGQQCGIPNDVLLEKSFISSCEDSYQAHWPAWMTVGRSIMAAYKDNDDPDIAEDVREARLQTIFSAHGDEIVFVD